MRSKKHGAHGKKQGGSKKGVFRGGKNKRNDKIFKKKKDKTKKESAKQTYCFNRYRDKKYVEEELRKKQILEEKIQNQYESSDSENEVEDPMQQLLSTFKSNGKKSSKTKAIDSDSSEESVDEEDVEMAEEEVQEELLDLEEQMESEEESGNSSSDDNDNTTNGKTLKKEDQKYYVDENNEEMIQPGQVSMENDDEEEATLNDPFTQHLQYDISDSLLESVSKKPQTVTSSTLNWPCLGKLSVQIPQPKESIEESTGKSKYSILEDKQYAKPGQPPEKIQAIDWNSLFIKKQIHPHIMNANKLNLLRRESELEDRFTPLQKEMLSIMNNYQDLYYPERSFVNGEEIRFTYCLHALNHLMKTRTKILHHNAKLSKKTETPDEFRDQGLVRPKVVIIVPFKDSAYKIIKILIDLLVPGDPSQVVNKNRFEQDFTGGELIMPKKNPKPEDYELTFSGNTEDTFRIGLSITKKTLKLYSEFYSSDLIIASPLGLRVIVGAEGEEDRDFDFLSSIEMLIMDQAEIFLMQNWDHLLHILDHFHLQPKKTHGTDFSRLRSWAVNGWTKYYRQTLIFSSVTLPEINAVFNKRCFNYAGKVKVCNPVEAGIIRHVTVQVPQVFRRVEVSDPVSAIDTRFEYFIKEILPQHKDSIMAHTMIYVPSYFDFVRIRNYFKKEDINFVQICEYSKDAKIARARDMFFHSEGHFLLYSERFHFFRRMRIKGIRHIIFYQPPIFPHFYSEMCNLMQEANQNKYGGSESNMTVTTIYTKYDLQQLSAIVSTARTSKMCQSDKSVHMFMTGE